MKITPESHNEVTIELENSDQITMRENETGGTYSLSFNTPGPTEIEVSGFNTKAGKYQTIFTSHGARINLKREKKEK
jgi:hypothetical protein